MMDIMKQEFFKSCNGWRQLFIENQLGRREGVEWKWRPAAWAQAARVWESRELKGKSSVGRGWC